jgi:hypothetical protein
VGKSSPGLTENAVNGGNGHYSPPPAPPKYETETQIKAEQVRVMSLLKTNRSPVVVRQPFSVAAENQAKPVPQAQPEKSASTMVSLNAASESSKSPVKRPSSTTANLVVEASEQHEASQPEEEDDFPCAVPVNFPTSLALLNDCCKLNSLHCFLREKVLEVFVVSSSDNRVKFLHTSSSSAGRVGFRCKFCAEARPGTDSAPENEVPMAVFYPKSLSEIYRLVTSWQRCHVRKCRNMPLHLRKEWLELRHDKARGKTSYWAESAHAIGLVDCASKAGGIRFRVDAKGQCVAPPKQQE